jgi:hypothetical protein
MFHFVFSTKNQEKDGSVDFVAYLLPLNAMTSIIKLQCISGGADSESPHCYLLQIDEYRILLDCGWDEKFSFEGIKELRK